jgi:hypothetical protein
VRNRQADDKNAKTETEGTPENNVKKLAKVHRTLRINERSLGYVRL